MKYLEIILRFLYEDCRSNIFMYERLTKKLGLKVDKVGLPDIIDDTADKFEEIFIDIY